MTTADLLRAAADALDDGTDPFTPGWLGEHNVTLDQCYSLAAQLAIGARIVAAGIENPRSPQGVAMLMAMAAEL